MRAQLHTHQRAIPTFPACLMPPCALQRLPGTALRSCTHLLLMRVPMAWRTFASRSETKKGMIRVFASLGPNHLMIYALMVNIRSSDRPWTANVTYSQYRNHCCQGDRACDHQHLNPR